jgi:hypothetical protein
MINAHAYDGLIYQTNYSPQVSTINYRLNEDKWQGKLQSKIVWAKIFYGKY